MNFDELYKYGTCFISPNLNISTWTNTTVFVVGCGGTGSRLVPLLAQHIANHNKEIQTNPRNNLCLKHKINLTLIDFDVV